MTETVEASRKRCHDTRAAVEKSSAALKMAIAEKTGASTALRDWLESINAYEIASAEYLANADSYVASVSDKAARI